jgi:hypothetical protein
MLLSTYEVVYIASVGTFEVGQSFEGSICLIISLDNRLKNTRIPGEMFVMLLSTTK